jgi:hypothetical protein
MTTDLPIPEEPVKKSGFSIESRDSRQKAYFVVSVVGTIRSKKEASLS